MTDPADDARRSAAAAPATGAILNQILDHINTARAAAGRARLTLDTTLTATAAAHTQLMTRGAGLTHQATGEPKLGDRLTAAGTHWKRCAENVGYTTSRPGDDALIRAANQLTDRMLAETPPGDGHRRNLLNPAYTRCGLAVQRTTTGTTWMTQDFTD